MRYISVIFTVAVLLLVIQDTTADESQSDNSTGVTLTKESDASDVPENQKSIDNVNSTANNNDTHKRK
ncbi:hypothetical protein evm_007628 [Chilo suppressalis]|nr:hypothetical protein evm_007628 [Chilo suppressalis]